MEELDKYWDNIHIKYESSYDGWLDKYLKYFNKDDFIVELGCGRAYSSKYLLENGYRNIKACDFSEEVLKIVNKECPSLKTELFDISDGLPFPPNSINIIVADLCLHYFNHKTTKYIFDEINRVLKDGGYLVARVNSLNDKNNFLENSKELEKNFYYDGKIYKRFFDKDDLEELFKKFQVYNLEEKNMARYEKTKVLWEFCLKK